MHRFALVGAHERERPKVLGACAFMHRVQLYDLLKYITMVLGRAYCGSFLFFTLPFYVEEWVYFCVDCCVLLCMCVCAQALVRSCNIELLFSVK